MNAMPDTVSKSADRESNQTEPDDPIRAPPPSATADMGSRASADISLEETVDTNDSKRPALAIRRKSGAPAWPVPFRFEVLLWFAGEVLDVDAEQSSFVALLTDAKGCRSRAEIAIASVDPRDHVHIVPGARFTYHVFQEFPPSGLRNSEEIVFEPLRRWTPRPDFALDTSGPKITLDD